MKKGTGLLVSIPLVVLFVITGGISAEGPEPPQEPPKPTREELQARIARLVEQLGASTWEERNTAQRKLLEIGEAARERLTEALASKDREIVHRAEQLLKEMEFARTTLVFVDKHGKAVSGKTAKITITPSKPSDYLLPDIDESGGREYEKVLSEDGGVQLPKMEPGSCWVTAEIEGYRTQEFQMTLFKGRHDRQITVYRGGRIRGRALDVKNDNKPIAGVQIQLFGQGFNRTVCTDEKGEFTVENVPPGFVWINTILLDKDAHRILQARWAGGTSNIVWAGGISNIVDEKTSKVTVTVIERKWCYGNLTFRIVDHAGKPLKSGTRANLMRMPSDSDTMFEFRSISFLDPYGSKPVAIGHDGALEIKDIETGRHNFVLSIRGYAPCVLKNVPVKGNATLRRKKDVKISEGIHLKVKVSGYDGKPLQGVTVLLADTKGPQRTFHRWPPGGQIAAEVWLYDTATSGKDGTVEFDSLAESSYAVRVYHHNTGLSQEMIVEVKAGDETSSVEIDYSKRSAIALRAVDEDSGGKVDGLGSQLYVRSGSFGIISEDIARKDKDRIKEHIIINDYGADLQKDGRERVILTRKLKGKTVVFTAPGYKPAIYRVKNIPEGKLEEVKVEMKRRGTGGLTVTLVPGNGMKMEDIGRVYFNSLAPLREKLMLFSSLQFALDQSEPPPLFAWGKEVVLNQSGSFTIRNVTEGPCYISIFTKEGKLRAAFRADAKRARRTRLLSTCPARGKSREY